MKDIVLATQNQHKLAEILLILKDLPVRLLSLNDFPEIGDIAETGDTFQENALIKARAVFNATGLLTLSDDSGLIVDALDGAPGVYSARYAGPAKDPAANNQKLLKALAGLPAAERTARFCCVVAIVDGKSEKVVEGFAEGRILEDYRGNGGFGYDPLFLPDGHQLAFAEMAPSLKNGISHRFKAFTAAATQIQRKLI